MADNVIQFPPPRPPDGDGYDGHTCPCGSAWFRAEGVTIGPDDRVTGYTVPLTCVECDRQWAPSLPVIGG